MGFIQEFVETVNEITTNYRRSTYPKIIKQMIGKHQLKRMKKMLVSLEKADQISVELLYSFVQQINITGRSNYLACTRVFISDNGTVTGANFRKTLNDEEVGYIFCTFVESQTDGMETVYDRMNVTYSVSSTEMKSPSGSIMRFHDKNIESAFINPIFIDSQFSTDTHCNSEVLRTLMYQTVKMDMVRYLSHTIENAEGLIKNGGIKK